MKRSKKLVSVLALTAVFAAIVPTLAQASPPTVASDIQYLSQGNGVKEENFGGSASTTEIPYLSHGVTSADVSGLGADDRPLSRATTVDPAPVVVTRDSGTSIDFGNPAVYGLALMLGLLAGGMGVAVWSNRRTKLSPA